MDHGDYLEIINGKKAVRIYEAVAVAFDCDRCGQTLDLPYNQQKKVK